MFEIILFYKETNPQKVRNIWRGLCRHPHRICCKQVLPFQLFPQYLFLIPLLIKLLLLFPFLLPLFAQDFLIHTTFTILFYPVSSLLHSLFILIAILVLPILLSFANALRAPFLIIFFKPLPPISFILIAILLFITTFEVISSSLLLELLIFQVVFISQFSVIVSFILSQALFASTSLRAFLILFIFVF